MNELNNYVDKLIKQSAELASDSDYVGEDGLIYCGKCHTPKQCRINIFEQIKTPFCLCKCEEEKRKREEAEKAKIKFDRMVADLRKDCFSDEKMISWNFANDDLSNPTVTKAMQKYVENFDEFLKDGRGLLLHGVIGTGKTYAACEVANALIDKGYPCYVTNFSRVLNGLSGTYDKQAYLDDLNDYKLLVIDDFGIERQTEFAKEQIYNVIDERYRIRLPLIITTNITMEQMRNTKEDSDKRIYDRLIEMCFPLKVDGKSRRKEKAMSAYEKTKKILEL